MLGSEFTELAIKFIISGVKADPEITALIEEDRIALSNPNPFENLKLAVIG